MPGINNSSITTQAPNGTKYSHFPGDLGWDPLSSLLHCLRMIARRQLQLPDDPALIEDTHKWRGFILERHAKIIAEREAWLAEWEENLTALRALSSKQWREQWEEHMANAAKTAAVQENRSLSYQEYCQTNLPLWEERKRRVKNHPFTYLDDSLSSLLREKVSYSLCYNISAASHADHTKKPPAPPAYSSPEGMRETVLENAIKNIELCKNDIANAKDAEAAELELCRMLLSEIEYVIDNNIEW